MDDAGAEVAAGGRERLEPVKQRVDKRAAAARVLTLPRTGVNHHSSRLVDNGQVRILKDYVQRNVFCRGLEGRRMRLAGDDDALTAAEFERCFLALAVDQNVALLHEH